MPTYVFTKESFLKFLESHLNDDVVVIVSSDVTDFRREKMESYVGEKEYFLIEFAVAADILKVGDDEFDELMKYTVVFADKDELSDDGRKALR